MNTRGFSLVEVLVAFAILALALVVIFRSYGLAAKSEAEAGRERAALDLARALIATGVDAAKVGTESGEEGQLHWRREIKLLPRAQTQTSLYRVAVTVETEGQQLELSTLTVRHDAAP